MSMIGRAELLAASNRRLADVIAPGLRLLFCGINPGLYSAATGHHFARPGNRFWPTLFRAGFTPRLLAPAEQRLLLDWGYGITNLVPRASVSAADLRREELIAGGRALRRKLRRFRPRWLAVVGVGAYRVAFDAAGATIGPQAERLEGCRVWVLPNPSGLNAHYKPAALAAEFKRLKNAVDTIGSF